MRRNEPVTNFEVALADGTMIVSTTDLKGTIQYVNRDFVEISGYTEAELLGQPHNLIRHPDMPPEAFADFWATLKAGRPWTGMVKNRCKNGDHYWVEANATPLRQDGNVVGYMSVRRKPSRDQVEAAERAYRAFREGKAAGLRIHRGGIVSDSAVASILREWRELPLRSGALGLAALVSALTAIVLLLQSRGYGPALLLPGVAMPVFAVAWLFLGKVQASSRAIQQHLQDLGEGRMNSDRTTPLGQEMTQLSDRVRSLAIKLGFDLADSRRRAEEATRIKVGLDNVATNIMIAGNDGVIIYLNDAIRRMFADAEADIRKELPAFAAASLAGANIDTFHRHPQHQRTLLANLTGIHRAQIRLGGRVFSLAASPVLDAGGTRLGTAVEWQDRTAEVAIEDQVSTVIQAAATGDLGKRISIKSHQRFVQVLSDSINQLLDTTSEVMSNAATTLSALAAGDLTVTMSGQYEGTFASLQQDLNQTVERLRGMVGEITEAISQIHTGAMEISKGNADLSQRTEQQAAHLEETAASAEQLTAAVRRNSDHTQQAQTLVTQARALANDSGETVAQVVQTMNAIDASSGKIADIVSLIDGIAFQTNILALNAAVEAARAGEQGRGFAVVASEVRSLAQRCAAAAKDVKSLIDESTAQVGTGTRQVDQAGGRIKDLVEAVRKVADLMGDISSATREQATGVDQVARTINEVDDTTQRNAALVEQASAAAENLEDQARRLNRLIAQFKLQNSAANSLSGSGAAGRHDRLRAAGRAR